MNVVLETVMYAKLSTIGVLRGGGAKGALAPPP